MDIHWGIKSESHTYEASNKRRKINNGEPSNKKKKLFEMDDERIYSVGTQVHFTAEINQDTIETLIKEITKVVNENLPKFGSKKEEKITIQYIVDSPGGSVTSVLKFVDFLRLVKERHPHIEFHSIITGLSASAGTIMCAVADKRFMTKHAFAMIHELSSGNMGSYTKLMSYTDFINKMHNALVDIYLDKCTQGKEALENLLQKESWFTASQYLELGFIDEIK